MMLLNLHGIHGIHFHAGVDFGPEHYFLFKSASTYCVKLYHVTKISRPLKTAVSAIKSFPYIIENVESLEKNKKDIDLDLKHIRSIEELFQYGEKFPIFYWCI